MHKTYYMESLIFGQKNKVLFMLLCMEILIQKMRFFHQRGTTKQHVSVEYTVGIRKKLSMTRDKLFKICHIVHVT
jgi:hypothetical protein